MKNMIYMLSKESQRKCHQLHALILNSSPSSSLLFLFNNLLYLYLKCGYLVKAHKVFERMLDRTIISYNAIISAYSKSPRHAISCIPIFREMQAFNITPNASTFSALSHIVHDQRDGCAIHCCVVVMGLYCNMFVKMSLLRMYLGCLCLESTETLFDEMLERDKDAWNSMLLSRLNGFDVGHAS